MRGSRAMTSCAYCLLSNRGQVDQPVVEEPGVPGEPRGRGGGPQFPGELRGPEAYGLQVGEDQAAQGAQGRGEGGGHAGLLTAGQGPLAGGP
ncbi:hypothetical protein OG264_17740 [Streptomyces xanthophaeus]|nr:hypothetical protein OG264_17740 [Streptomyces xanthophaeus]WST61851.1 hypothetical protein OG605_20695 [Streptomyces xanthophaeus]